MKTFILIEQSMLPVPSNITVIQNFGYDSIVHEDDNHNTRVARGKVELVEGTDEAFKSWLGKHPGFWTSKSPMMGWEVSHIKETSNG